MKDLLIKLGLLEDDEMASRPVTASDAIDGTQVSVDAGWYQQAMKHYCGTCEQWFKTASIANHNRFKHKDA